MEKIVNSELKWPDILRGTKGKPLSSIKLEKFDTSCGHFSWKDPDEIIADDVHGFGVYWMTFTPNGADSYTEETVVVVEPVRSPS